MLRVLYVCTVPTGRSGIPNVIFNLLRAIDKSQMELGYVSINEPDDYYKKQLVDLGVSYCVITREIKHPWRYIKNLKKVAENYDVVHVHGNSATMVLEMIAAKLAGVKVRIAHSHNTTCNLRTIDRIFRSIFYQLCNSNLACGAEAGQWLFRKRKFKIVNNGIDTDACKYSSEIRHKLKSRLDVNDKFVLGHVGNFNNQKNHQFLIDVFHEYHNINKDSCLILLGDGVLRGEIEQKVKTLDLNKDVYFMGSVDCPIEYMNAMDMVIMPSLYEGLPLTMIEEQANGLNILAADTITPDSNLSGLVRFKSLQDSPHEWAEEIETISKQVVRSQSVSDDAIKKIKEAGYDINMVAADLKSYYVQKISEQ